MALMLTRHRGEKVIIKDGESRIEIFIGGQHGKQVVLGIDAPQKYAILREEVEKRNERH